MSIFTSNKAQMRRESFLIVRFCIMLLCGMGANSLKAQIVFTSGAGLTQTQNFNSVPVSGTMPAGWRYHISATPSYSAGITTPLRIGGTSGSGALTASSIGGTYSFTNGVATAAPPIDRASGFLNALTGATATDRSLMTQLSNNTGLIITDLSVSFDYEKYRSGYLATNLTFFYSLDGNNWIPVSAGDQSYAADGTNSVVSNPPTGISKTNISITGLNVANNANIYLRWNYSGGTGTGTTQTGQAIGVDNLSVTASVSAGACTPPAQATLFAASGPTTSSIDLSWSTVGTNVLIVRRLGSAPTNNPLSGSTYTAGQGLGNGDSVVYVGTNTSVTAGSLMPNAQYYFRIFSFDPTGFTGSTPCYNSNSAPVASATTGVCLSTQVTGLSAVNVQGNALDLAMTLPTGAQVIILKKSGATAITDLPAQGAAYTPGDPIGASTVAYIGNATSVSLTGLTTNTQYQFAVFAYDPTGYNSGPCYLTPAATLSATTSPCNSTAQVSGFTAGTPTNYSIPLSWSTPANQVIIFKRAGTAVASSPVNGSTYTIGQTLGSQESVAYIGSAANAAAIGLSPNTNYYFRIFAFDPTGFTGSTPCYNTISSAPQLGPLLTANCPSGQVTNLSSLTLTATSIGLSWTPPVGGNVIILQKSLNTALPATAYPVSGTTYNLNDITATNVGGAGINVTVAYIGSASSTTITGLTANTSYRYEIFSFDPTAYNGMPCYYLNSPAAIGAFTAPCDGGPQISSITATNPTANSIDVSWSAPVNQVIIVRSNAGSITVPSQGTNYTLGQDIGGFNIILYKGSAAGSLTAAGLTQGRAYTFTAYSYDPAGYTGGTPCYNWYSAPTSTDTTATCISAPASNLTATGATNTSINLNMTLPAGASSLVLVRAGNPVSLNLSDLPVQGTAYTAGQALGVNTVAYVGASTSPIITGLTPGTVYHFAAYSFNPTGYPGGTPCYEQNSTPPVANTATIACVAPTTSASGLSFSNVSNNALTVNWINGNGVNRVVLINTANTFTAPVNGTDPSANNIYAGSGEHVVYNGSANAATITGLNQNTTYYVAIYESNCAGANVRFNTTALTGSQATIGTPVITTAALSGNIFCAGTPQNVDFTASGSYTAGNTFTAQLSDSAGSFASPQVIGTLNSTASGTNMIIAIIPGNTPAGTGYRMRVVSSSPAATGSNNGTDLTINTGNENATQTQTISGSTDFPGLCANMVRISPSGASPVSGSVTVVATTDPTVQSYGGTPYLQRHFDITPSINPNTATADITLYYTQTELDAYNAANGATADLPANPTDVAAAANFRITQYHGTSSTGQPGSYTGWTGSGPAAVLITPTSVNWSTSSLRWEVTFPVTGFSGFFATSVINAPLPIKLHSFTASRDGAQRNRLDWRTVVEAPGTTFTAERSADGLAYKAIGKVAGKGSSTAYILYDDQALSGTNYYRLKMVDASSSITYSNTLAVRNNLVNTAGVTLAPLPVFDQLTISNTDVSLNGSPAIVTNMHGQDVLRFNVDKSTTIDVSKWLPGVYFLRLSNGQVLKIVKK